MIQTNTISLYIMHPSDENKLTSNLKKKTYDKNNKKKLLKSNNFYIKLNKLKKNLILAVWNKTELKIIKNLIFDVIFN